MANWRNAGSSQGATFQLNAAGEIIGLAGSSHSFLPRVNPMYRRLSAAFARVRSNNGNARILFQGDSTTASLGSVTPGSSVAGQTKCYTQAFATILNASGIKATANNICGSQAHTTVDNFIAYDTRLTHSAAAIWSAAASPSLKGYALNATGNSITLTLGTSQTQWDIVYYDGVGTFSWTGSTSGTANVVMANTGLVKRISVAATGTALTIANVSGTILLQGVSGYLAATSEVQIMNGGVGGSKVADHTWVSSATLPIPAWNFDLVIIELGLNDLFAGVSTAQFKADLQVMIDAHTANGTAVMLSTCNPRSIAGTSLAVQQTYVDALYELATTNGLIVLDIFKLFGSYEVGNPLGMYSDSWHPGGIGYSAKAAHVASLLRNF